jgi:L-ribulose-5-phosphate 3-epimerase UlaE
MNPAELKERTKLLGHTCTKLALLLPQNNIVAMHLRNELLAVSLDLPVKTRCLMVGSSTANFASKLSDCSELTERCSYILEFIVDEKMMEQNLVSPLIDECNELIQLFYAAFKSVKDRLDG